MVKSQCCDPGNISIVSRLTIMYRPFYRPREFTAVIATAVYIPPQVETDMALSKLHNVLSVYLKKNLDAVIIVTADCHTNLSPTCLLSN